MAIGDLVTANFMYEINGIVIGSGTDFITSKVEGLLAKSTIKTTDFDRMDAWGEYPGRDMYQGRKITFTVDVLGLPDPAAVNPIQTNYDNLMKAIAVPDVAPPAPAFQMVFQRAWVVAGKRYAWARPGKSAVTSDSDFVLGHFQVVFELKCNDPRYYSLTEITDAYTIANTTNQISGVTTNSGDTAALPIIDINGPATNPIVANANDGNKSLAVTVTLAAGDLLEIDMRLRSIKKNGVDISGSMTTSSQFWKLQPGANAITYQRTDSGASSLMNLRHRHTWSG